MLWILFAFVKVVYCSWGIFFFFFLKFPRPFLFDAIQRFLKICALKFQYIVWNHGRLSLSLSLILTTFLQILKNPFTTCRALGSFYSVYTFYHAAASIDFMKRYLVLSDSLGLHRQHLGILGTLKADSQLPWLVIRRPMPVSLVSAQCP